LKFDLDPAQPFTLWTAVLGFALLNIGFFGTDQDGTQRMLTCKSSAHASRSMLSAVILGIPVTFLFMAVGLLLWVFYTRPDLMGDAAPEAAGSSMKIFLQFIMTHMPPGMSGLMMAGLIAAGLSSLNSALNAMSSTFVNDFYRHKCRDRGEEHYLFVGRAGVMVAGVILGLFGVLCFFWKQSSDIPLVDFALLVMAFAYSGLVAIFLTVMLTNRGSNLSVIAALVVGFLIVLVMQKAVWTSITPQSWHDLKIAFPWQMLLATLIAFAVCCLGKQPRDQSDDSVM
jgi:Na+/proline symporter